MFLKHRTESIVHLIYEQLYCRMKLSAEAKRTYWNQVKGWEGELAFDEYLKKLPLDCLILNDLRIKDNNTDCQIDALIIVEETIYVYEVKNYSGNYTYKNGILESENDVKIPNPAGQLHKWIALISNICRRMGLNFEVKGFVVFIHPEFFLYRAPETEPFLFVSQLPRHFKSVVQSFFVTGDKQNRLAKKLLALHDEDYRPPNLPSYEYDELRKGIFCPVCLSFEHEDTRKTRRCKKCGHEELIDDAILRNIKVLKILFPDLLITKALAVDWCGPEYKPQRIFKVLRTHFRMCGQNKAAHYV